MTKRKRKEPLRTSASSAADDDTSVQPVGQPNKRIKKKSSKSSPDSTSNESQLNTPMPTDLTDLYQSYQSLNVAFIVVASRSAQPKVKFSSVQKTVVHQTSRPFTQDDLKMMVFLIPDMVKCYWLDKQALLDELNTYHPPSVNSTELEWELMIEFVDGITRKKAKRAKSIDMDKSRKTIEYRNEMFRRALNKFLESIPSGVSPLDHLRCLSKNAIPPPPLVNPPTATEGMNSFDAPPSVISLVQSLQGEEFFKNQIVDIKTQAARAANYSDGTDLEPKLKSFLSKAKNINILFSHQAEALNEIASGNHVVLATPTSSGKSLAYQLPILSRLERDKNATFLYICPTKALAQDQYRSWKDFFKGTDYDWAQLATYDGDTDQSLRSNIREFGNIILTNPDMLHVSILPNHYLWSRFLENLKIVVVDELHSYQGVFGSHCALIFRRLRRLCEHYGNRSVQFFACSATISNPVEHGTKMFGLSNDQLKIVDKDGSPGGQRSYIFWNPPYVNPRDPSLGRINSLGEAANLFLFFVKRNVKTVVFARHRKGCELLFKDVTTTILSTSSTATSSNAASDRSLIHLLSKIKSYRGGYRKDERRNIEQGLFSGQLLGVVATNALELGIDIGGIDCVIHLGFPGVNAMHQQAGRAGRRGRDSLSILVADSNPLDQYYMKNPNKLFENGLEDVAISPENLLLLESHLRCAAFELPITTETDVRLFGSSIYEICQKSLKKQDDVNVYTTEEVNPALQIPIRAIEQDLYSVYDVTNNQRCLMEEIESSRAAFSLYIGGIYLHQGKSYLILDVNTEHRFAKVKYTNVEWITMCRDYTDVDPVRPLKTRKLRGEAFAGYGDIKTITKVFAYHQIDPRKQSIIDRHEIDTPPIIRLSKGAWVDIGIDTVRFVESKTDDSIYAALHSVAHTILSLAPMIVVGMSDDCYTECVSPDARRHRPFRLIFGDARCGGTGLSKKLYDHIELLLDKAYEVIFNCGCPEGCPECILWNRCRENNVVVSKLGALSILSHVLGKEQTGPESRSTRLDSPKITEDGEKIIVTPSGTKVYVGNKNRQGQKNVYTELGRIIKSSKMEDFEGEDFKVE